MRIGFGIITYEKFEETKILADAIKALDRDYYVLACSNHPDAKKQLSYPNIDRVALSEDIPFSAAVWAGNRSGISMNMRVTANIQKCNQELIKQKELDYCVFLHSDSWVLSREGILSIIKVLKEKGKHFAVTGIGFSFMNSNTPFGNILDMMWVYDRKEIENDRLFEFDVAEMMPHKMDSHGIISTNLIVKVGLSRIYYYADASQAYIYKSKYLTEKVDKFKYINVGIPAVYFDKQHFIHIHTGAFTNGLGEQMQAYFLRKYGLTKGAETEKFLEKYRMGEKELFESVKALERKVARKLRWLGLGYEVLGMGKNYAKIMRTLDRMNIFQKIALSLSCWGRWIFIKAYTRERYYDGLHGAKTTIGLGKYYSENIINKSEFEKFGHSRWYEEYKDIK